MLYYSSLILRYGRRLIIIAILAIVTLQLTWTIGKAVGDLKDGVNTVDITIRPAFPTTDVHIASSPNILLRQSPNAQKNISNQTNSSCTIGIFRIIGNDLPPRHDILQTLRNVQFILDHEIPPQNLNVEYYWILNRILNGTTESAIINLLESRSQRFLRLAFNETEYLQIKPSMKKINPLRPGYLLSESYENTNDAWKAAVMHVLTHHKNLYVMNNNGARNFGVEFGRKKYNWTFVLDGNIFLPEQAWTAGLESTIVSHCSPKQSTVKYIILPMDRVNNNTVVLNPSWKPASRQEPQIAFRNDAEELYDLDRSYSNNPKMEFLWRIGHYGIPKQYQKPQKPTYSFWVDEYAEKKLNFRFWKVAGFVARLSSGSNTQDGNDMGVFTHLRQEARRAGVQRLLNSIDAKLIHKHCHMNHSWIQSDYSISQPRVSGQTDYIGQLKEASQLRQEVDTLMKLNSTELCNIQEWQYAAYKLVLVGLRLNESEGKHYQHAAEIMSSFLAGGRCSNNHSVIRLLDMSMQTFDTLKTVSQHMSEHVHQLQSHIRNLANAHQVQQMGDPAQHDIMQLQALWYLNDTDAMLGIGAGPWPLFRVEYIVMKSLAPHLKHVESTWTRERAKSKRCTHSTYPLWWTTPWDVKSLASVLVLMRTRDVMVGGNALVENIMPDMWNSPANHPLLKGLSARDVIWKEIEQLRQSNASSGSSNSMDVGLLIRAAYALDKVRGLCDYSSDLCVYSNQFIWDALADLVFGKKVIY